MVAKPLSIAGRLVESSRHTVAPNRQPNYRPRRRLSGSAGLTTLAILWPRLLLHVKYRNGTLGSFGQSLAEQVRNRYGPMFDRIPDPAAAEHGTPHEASL